MRGQTDGEAGYDVQACQSYGGAGTQTTNEACARGAGREFGFVRRLQDSPATLSEFSPRYAVSCERVSQIERRALEKMRRAVAASAASARC
jgi:hypothetical protein